jgi:hypothetical protein
VLNYLQVFRFQEELLELLDDDNGTNLYGKISRDIVLKKLIILKLNKIIFKIQILHPIKFALSLALSKNPTNLTVKTAGKTNFFLTLK